MKCLSRLFLFGLMLSCVGTQASVVADWKDDIGYTALQARIGAMLEDGAGVVVAMSEAPDGSDNYLPDLASSQFTGKTIIDETGTNTDTNGHANTVARLFFGNSGSIAPGVTEVHAYEAGNWITSATGAGAGTDPVSPEYKIINNSWIGTMDTEGDAVTVLSHVDYMADQYETLVISGSSNSGSLPQLMAHSYNSLLVGRTNGGHGSGQTGSFYGPGRTKPDLVAPASFTSFSTPLVSSAATLLYQKAMGTDATRSESMRAVLMAGATKDEFVDWDRTTSRPLDEEFGAGELNVDNSYRILEGGQFTGSLIEPATSVGAAGWDYQATFDSTGALYYDLEVADGMLLDDLSIILAWNVEVLDGDPSSTFDPSLNLADFSLRLYDSTDSFLGTELDASLSAVDNVEHIFVQQLSAGRYTIEITGDQDRDFALAWHSSFTAVPEPASGFGLAFAAVLLLSTRRNRPR